VVSKPEATITIGYDRRCWATFQVADPTPEEIAVLSQTDTDEALELARTLEAADRLSWVDEQADQNPDYWSEYAHPAVIELTEYTEDTLEGTTE